MVDEQVDLRYREAILSSMTATKSQSPPVATGGLFSLMKAESLDAFLELRFRPEILNTDLYSSTLIRDSASLTLRDWSETTSQIDSEQKGTKETKRLRAEPSLPSLASVQTPARKRGGC